MALLTVRLLPIHKLIPAPYNPRKTLTVKDAAYRKLKASLVRFGLVEPLIWNERTGYVVGGHLRLKLLVELGYAEVPVSVVQLTDAEEKALNVVLNNKEAQGRYDPEKLELVLAQLQDMPEIELTGFDVGVLDEMQFEPQECVEDSQVVGDVEVTLRTDRATYEKFAMKLDPLVREYDLQARVRMR